MDLSIIIVSYNTKDLLHQCLSSIAKSTDTLTKEIIVVDNNSQDGSVEMVQTSFPSVKLLTFKNNRGFGVANNQGAKEAIGEYLFFLNSDAYVKKTTLQTFFKLVNKSKAGLASCRLENPDGSLQPQGGFLPHLFNILFWMWFIDDIPFLNANIPAYQLRRPSFFLKNQIMGWVGGTALLIKRRLFADMGGFDEHIFMYTEDVDLCYRARYRQEKVFYFQKPRIIHLGQGSSTSGNSILGEFKGLKYLFTKHKPPWQLPILRFLLKSGALLRIIVFGIIARDDTKKRIYEEAYRLA